MEDYLEYKQMCAELDYLRSENERLRRALEDIKDGYLFVPDPYRMIEIARKALEEQS